MDKLNDLIKSFEEGAKAADKTLIKALQAMKDNGHIIIRIDDVIRLIKQSSINKLKD